MVIFLIFSCVFYLCIIRKVVSFRRGGDYVIVRMFGFVEISYFDKGIIFDVEDMNCKSKSVWVFEFKNNNVFFFKFIIMYKFCLFSI